MKIYINCVNYQTVNLIPINIVFIVERSMIYLSIEPTLAKGRTAALST